MRRHELDVLPALLGALLVVVGTTYVLADLRGEHVHEAVLGSLTVAGLGLLAFAATLRAIVRAVRRRR